MGESIVGELFDGDLGTDSPNPVNHYQLQKVGLGSYNSLVHQLGYAYSWAQKICGLDFLLLQVCCFFYIFINSLCCLCVTNFLNRGK